MTSPLPEALARLREEVRLAEAALDRVTHEGGSFLDGLAAAGDLHAARSRLTASSTSPATPNTTTPDERAFLAALNPEETHR